MKRIHFLFWFLSNPAFIRAKKNLFLGGRGFEKNLICGDLI